MPEVMEKSEIIYMLLGAGAIINQQSAGRRVASKQLAFYHNLLSRYDSIPYSKDEETDTE